MITLMRQIFIVNNGYSSSECLLLVNMNSCTHVQRLFQIGDITVHLIPANYAELERIMESHSS